MLVVQLFIQDERVDLFKDETIKISQTLKNIKDVAKIFTDFTQSFTIPATPTNNKIFKHYYNADIVNGYDARAKVDAVIELNNVPFKKGKIKLNSVSLKDRKPENYKITFYGATVELKDLIGEDKLSSLPLDVYSKLYGPGAVLGGLSQNFVDSSAAPKAVITPLITHTKRLYYSSNSADSFAQSGNLKPTNDPNNAGNYKQGLPWTQLKYAINVNKLIEAIETKYSQPVYPVNLRFSSDFFNNASIPKMNNLYMWLHRKSGHVENLSGNEETITPVDEFDSLVTSPVVGPGNYPDNGFFADNQFLFITSPGSGGFLINFQFVQFKIEVNVPPSETDPYRVRMFANFDDTPVFVSSQVTGDSTYTWSVNNPAFNPSDIDDFLYFGSVLAFDIVAENVINVSDFKVTVSYYGGKVIGSQTSFFNFTSFISAGPFSTASVFRFNITQQIPELKTIDLLSGLFKMFNLVAFVDTQTSTDDTKNIIVKPLDDFYSTFNTYEIDEYVDINKEDVNVALPYKKVLFKYKDSKSFLAERYRQLANKGWGELSYTDEALQEIGGALYKVEVPFGHFQFERLVDPSNPSPPRDIQWGWSVNESQNAYKGAPLLFYPIFQNVGAYSVGTEVSSDNIDEITTVAQRNYANIPSNSLRIDANQGDETLHFGHEINEYTRDTSFTGSLFKEEYLKYIQDIFNGRRRIIKIKAYLPLKILLNYSLSDRFIYKGSCWNINKITTNLTTGESDLELINVITEEDYD